MVLEQDQIIQIGNYVAFLYALLGGMTATFLLVLLLGFRQLMNAIGKFWIPRFQHVHGVIHRKAAEYNQIPILAMKPREPVVLRGQLVRETHKEL